MAFAWCRVGARHWYEWCTKARYGGKDSPRDLAHARYAPGVTRFLTYRDELGDRCRRYCETITALQEMQDWIAAAKQEPEAIQEFEMEF